MEKKSALALSDFLIDPPFTVESNYLVTWLCLAIPNNADLPVISDLGDDPQEYAVSVAITVHNSPGSTCYFPKGIFSVSSVVQWLPLIRSLSEEIWRIGPSQFPTIMMGIPRVQRILTASYLCNSLFPLSLVVRWFT